MINTALIKIKRKWDVWVRKRNTPGNPQIVDARNLYLLPSGFGWAYGVVVLLLLVGAVNYQNNLIFLMTFILGIVGMVSACEAHGNILNLTFKLIEIEDAEQGLPTKVSLFIHANNKIRYGVGLKIASQGEVRAEIIPTEGLAFTLTLETVTRGHFILPPIVISSFYPFAIFRVWSYAYFNEHYYVYPKPVNPGFWPDPYPEHHGDANITAGDEEFYELKQVEDPWVEPKRIAWKIAARGQGWYLKKMKSNDVESWLFKLNDLPSEDIELQLQYLSFWLQSAEADGLIYGLALPLTTTKFSHGKEHLQHCLRQLALYQ